MANIPDSVAAGSVVTPGSYNIPLAEWPKQSLSFYTNESKPPPSKAALQEVAATVVNKLQTHLKEDTFQGVADMFVPQGYWRDHLALSWQLRTLKGRERIGKFLSTCDGKITSIELDESSDFRAPRIVDLDFDGKARGIRAFLRFKTEIGSGRGVIHIACDASLTSPSVWTLYLSLERLADYDELINLHRPKGVEHDDGRPEHRDDGAGQGESSKPSEVEKRLTWAQTREEEADFTDSQPDVVIIGAGQAGLSICARLKTMGVSALVIDQAQRVGDNWRSRYDTLVLHDPVWFDHLPYVNFPATWPIFTPKDKMGDFLEAYASMLDLNVWTSTAITASPEWNAADGNWVLHVFRGDAAIPKPRNRTLRPKHMIQATGHAGEAFVPPLPGIATFPFPTWHSSTPISPNRTRAPRAEQDAPPPPWHVLIIGSCNSAHDLAQQLLARRCAVTLLQRSSTCVLSSAAMLAHGLRPNYAEAGPPVEDADLCLWGTPAEALKAQHVRVAARQAGEDGETLRGLRERGFRVDGGPDGAGLFLKYLQRGGGYYIDIGASRLIAEGRIGVKNGEVAEVVGEKVVLDDGMVICPDEIVFATGYQNMVSVTRRIFGDEVAGRVGNVWGFDKEGEMRGIWRATGQQGLWMMGGNLAFCRYFSRILALQIKAQLVGMNPYEKPA